MTLQSLDKYGIDFQIKVISSLLTHKEFLSQIHEILSEEYFSNSAHKWIIREILNYYDEYNTTPTMEVLKIEIQKIPNEILEVSVIETLKKAYTASQDDLKYVQEEFSSFVKNQGVKRALLNSVDLLKEEDFESIKNVLHEALRAGEVKDLGHIYEKDIETRYRADSRNVLPFPWKAFNNVTQGGYGDGDLVLLFGSPKSGKSWIAMIMAALLVELGYNVVFYALELGESYVGKRFDSIFTGIAIDELEDNRPAVEAAVKKLKGKLVIKDYPPKRATLNTIEAHLDRLEMEVDAVFIDYLDLLSNPRHRADNKGDLDDIYTSAKGLAKELQIPIISPSQANRAGNNQAILEADHIAGSFNKIMIGDIVISLARGRKDKLDGVGRFHFMGNRYGPDGITFFASHIDTSNGTIVIEEEIMDDDEVFSGHKNNEDELDNFEKKKLNDKFNQFFNR